MQDHTHVRSCDSDLPDMRDDSQRCVGPPSQLECLHQNADFTPEPTLHNRTRLYNRTRTSQPRLHSRIQTPWHTRTDLKSSSARTVGAHRNMSREPRTQVSLRASRQRRPRQLLTAANALKNPGRAGNVRAMANRHRLRAILVMLLI
jgi:hypothetical protein